jgi:hypothetical protein
MIKNNAAAIREWRQASLFGAEGHGQKAADQAILIITAGVPKQSRAQTFTRFGAHHNRIFLRVVWVWVGLN